MTDVEAARAGVTREFIIFGVAANEYCVDIKSVKEIRGWSAAMPLPQSPQHFRGVINLRGNALPIIDLSALLGFSPAVPTATNAIVVVQVGTTLLGLLVDGVTEIMTFSEDKIQPTPDAASETAKELVSGVILDGERIISALAVEALMPSAPPDPKSKAA